MRTSYILRLGQRFFALLALLAALATAFFFAKVQERDQVLGAFIRDATRGVALPDTESVILALSNAIYQRTNRGILPGSLPIYERLESMSFFNMSSTVSLKRGAYGVVGSPQFGSCGTMSRTLLASLWQLGIPARKLHLFDHADGTGSGHTLVEFRTHGRWRVISPSDSSFVWRNRAGQIATVDDIRADPEIFAQIFGRDPRYPYRFDHPSWIRWSKLKQPLPKLAQWILGEKRYRSMSTPSLYDRPRHLFLYTSLAVLGLSSLLAIYLGRRSRVAPAAWKPRALDPPGFRSVG